MTGPLQLAGALTIAAGIILAITTGVPMEGQIAYVVAGLISSFFWFAAAEALSHLKAIRETLERKS